MSKETVEEELAYIGITRENVRTDAFNHWKRYIEFVKLNSGKNWQDIIRPMLRSYIGIDFRYIDDYHKACNAWGITKSVNGNLFFIGIPFEISDKERKEQFKKFRKKQEEVKANGQPLP